jgi:hypothetical protein
MVDQAGAVPSLGRCGHATNCGLRLRPGLALDDWVCAGRTILKVSSASAWWVGDWLVYGERTYGTRYKAALDLTHLDYKTLRNYAWVARRVRMSRRRDGLSFQHHAEVAALPEPQQDLWLARAQTLHWSRNELRRQIASAREPGHVGGVKRDVVLRLHVPADRERQWREAAQATEQPLDEWIARAADEMAEAVLSGLRANGWTRRRQPAAV